MSHGIDGKYDMVLGCTKTENPETGLLEFDKDWHGLTKGVEVLDDNAVRPMLFPVLERSLGVDVDGITVTSDKAKMLIADLRECRAGEFGENPADYLLPLHTPKDGYRVITNAEVYAAAKTCISDIGDAQIERVFTLEALTKFGVSIKIGEKEIGVKRFNGAIDKTLCQLNLITSHDGKYACEAYDSTVRIVCMNTLRWSREAAGKVGFKVYHTKGADTAMKTFPALVNAILAGRVRFKNDMEYLDTLQVTKDESLYIALAFLASLKVDKEAVSSTRNLNAAEEIQLLFLKGKGNYGITALDLLNGATEYYTSGDGTGQRSTPAVKAFKADFGTAADHKEAFVNYLMGGNLKEYAEAGRKLYVEAMKD
jgi:hypothetical protein